MEKKIQVDIKNINDFTLKVNFIFSNIYFLIKNTRLDFFINLSESISILLESKKEEKISIVKDAFEIIDFKKLIENDFKFVKNELDTLKEILLNFHYDLENYLYDLKNKNANANVNLQNFEENVKRYSYLNEEIINTINFIDTLKEKLLFLEKFNYNNLFNFKNLKNLIILLYEIQKIINDFK